MFRGLENACLKILSEDKSEYENFKENIRDFKSLYMQWRSKLMKNVYFISYTIYADGDYQQIINKGSTTMELTVSELRQLGKVHNALVHFNILDARKNGGDFRPDSDLIVIDNISKIS